MEELWQEHKRWILGVAGGLLLFYIGIKIVDGIYDSAGAERRLAIRVRNFNREELFDQKMLKDLEADTAALAERADVLRKAAVFTLAEEFQAVGKADLDGHYDLVSRRVRDDVMDTAMAYSVDLSSSDLRWDTPVGREEIADTLVGLSLLEEVALRMLEAGEVVKGRDPDAIGLVGIDLLRVDGRPSERTRRRRSGAQQDGLPESYAEYRLTFEFRADEATVSLFLEKCRSDEPVICLQGDGFSMRQGRDIGDPVLTKGQVLAITMSDL
ncbi:MAG: hypothetical protein ACYTG5_12745 [Planctomycetota bacterium]